MVLRSVCCRSGRSRAPPVKSCKRCSSRVKRACNESSLDTRCRQFDGQRQPIESQTDLGNGRSIVRCQLENRMDGLCPLEEQVAPLATCASDCSSGKCLGSGRARGGTANWCSARRRNTSRLVTRILRSGQASNSSDKFRCGCRMTCSKLSRSRSWCLSR